MFLYVNRWQPTPISFDAEESPRYIPNKTISSKNTSYVFRMGHVRYQGLEFIDINRPGTSDIPAATELISVKNYVKLIHNSTSHWVLMDGTLPKNQFRWLSKEGDFEVLSLSNEGNLSLEISAGPDLAPENTIQLLIDGAILEEIHPDKLPVKLQIPITNSGNKYRFNGQIKILGPVTGIRQVGVARIVIDS
jgi:hypothetical protein